MTARAGIGKGLQCWRAKPASVSEEDGAAVEEVSAGAEEMSAHRGKVVTSTQSLAEMARTLQKAFETAWIAYQNAVWRLSQRSRPAVRRC